MSMKHGLVVTRQVPYKCPVCKGHSFLCHSCDYTGIVWGTEKEYNIGSRETIVSLRGIESDGTDDDAVSNN